MRGVSARLAAAGNAVVRLMGARITFDHRMIPLLPTRERAEREAEAMREVVQYFRQHGARVVKHELGRAGRRRGGRRWRGSFPSCRGRR